jgi:hypothetical protein
MFNGYAADEFLVATGSLTCHFYCPASGSSVSFHDHVSVMTI